MKLMQNIFNRPPIVQSFLLKLTLIIMCFLLAAIVVLSWTYWDKAELNLKYDLLLKTLHAQAKIESQINYIEGAKGAKGENAASADPQTISRMAGLILPLIQTSDSNYAIAYYDVGLKTLIQDNTKPNQEFDRLFFNNNSLIENTASPDNNYLTYNLPVYNEGVLSGVVRAYASKKYYLLQSFYDTRLKLSSMLFLILLLALAITVLLITVIRKYFIQKEGLTVFSRDISKLKQQRQELGRLEKLNLIGQMSAGIGHEIRNPLTTVKGFLQFFESKPNYLQDKDYLDLMISEIDRANKIISDFLSLAKAAPDNTKLQNLNSAVEKIFPMLQADAFTSNKEVILDLNDVPEILMDENEIRQLILNLVRNGLEVTAEQGKVIISTYSNHKGVVLAVTDQGPGIPQNVQEKLGTPFFTTKENGTGLGLTISMGIAQRHEAVFEFDTGKNGTVFRTIFPALDENSCAYTAEMI